MLKNKLPLWLAKVLYYEYWPVNIFYFPFSFYWLLLSIRARSLTYYTAANPGIANSGFWGDSKAAVLKKIPLEYLPLTLYITEKISAEKVVDLMKENGIEFPVICKPDKGERGYKVEKVNTINELSLYLETANELTIVQEFIDYPAELGILYYKLPDGTESSITSVVKKGFLSVTGDGISTISELMNKSLRARFQLESIQKKMGDKMNWVLAHGEQLVLEPIGNHCRGTQFLNGNDLINPQLISVFDKLAEQIDGFYYGRFDLRVKSIEDLYAGKNIKIMELNGVTSEPAHIYGPDMNLISAIRSVIHHSNILFKISMQNKKKGAKFTPFFPFVKHLLAYKKSLKKV